MQKPYQIVHSVHEAFRGLAGKLSRITGKSETLWRSHGYEPRNANPMANGNPSPVTDYMAYCELLQAAERGAGRMLASRVHSELQLSFAESDPAGTQADLHVGVIDEGCDVQRWLASKDLSTASRCELAAFETECDEAIEAIQAAKARARAIRRVKSAAGKVKDFGRAASC